MSAAPEQRAREAINRLLAAADWAVQDVKAADLHAARGVALREFELNAGHGTADHLLYVDARACGVVEAKKPGATLTGVEIQSARYAQGLPASLPAWRRPLPFVYESTDTETHFTNTLEPEPRAQHLRLPSTGDACRLAAAGGCRPGPGAGHRARHRQHAATTRSTAPGADDARPAAGDAAARHRVGREHRLWPAQITAIRNLERSLAQNKPRALNYAPEELDRSVQTPDQIRTIARTLRDKWKTDLFPQREALPKTLVFAKDDNHAEEIVRIWREEFGGPGESIQKITYRTTGAKPEALIKAFRTSYHPRIAVTVDMIATGTDIKPVEIVVFCRAVKSRSFFEQMKGRGVRVIEDDDLRGVNPGEHVHKDRFVIVDCVGVCERDKTDSRPLDQKKSVPLPALLQAVSLGNVEPEVMSSIAVRLARLDARLSDAERAKVQAAAGGPGLKELARGIVQALDPREDRSPQEAEAALLNAVKPLSNPALRTLILTLKASKELVIDTVTQDRVLEAGFSEAARERAQGIVQSFEAFIEEHRDEITALQILYNRPTRTGGAPLKFEDLKALAATLQAPPRLWTESRLWQAYAALDASKGAGKVRGTSRRRILTDLVSLVRYAMHQENELVPYPERVMANLRAWLARQDSLPAPHGVGGEGRRFTDEQRWWLERMAEHIASNLGIEAEDFGYAPFDQRGGLGRVHQLFGAELPAVLASLNDGLAG